MILPVRLTSAADPAGDGFERYVGLEHLDPGELTVQRWGEVAAGTTFTSVFRPGQVFFGKRRAYQRKVAVPDFSGVCSGDIYVLESRHERHLLPEPLPFICQTHAFYNMPSAPRPVHCRRASTAGVWRRKSSYCHC